MTLIIEKIQLALESLQTLKHLNVEKSKCRRGQYLCVCEGNDGIQSNSSSPLHLHSQSKHHYLQKDEANNFNNKFLETPADKTSRVIFHLWICFPFPESEDI